MATARKAIQFLYFQKRTVEEAVLEADRKVQAGEAKVSRAGNETEIIEVPTTLRLIVQKARKEGQSKFFGVLTDVGRVTNLSSNVYNHPIVVRGTVQKSKNRDGRFASIFGDEVEDK